MWKSAAAALFGLAGCVSTAAPPIVPIDERDVGVGHGVGYESYESARIAAEQGHGDAAATQPERVISSEELAAAGLPVADGSLPAPEPITEAPLDAMAPSDPAPVNRSRLSDEQSFDAVSSRETIESDAQRLARQAQAYRVIPPAPVPTRNRSGGTNIVAYALSTTNSVGQQVFSRSGFNMPGRARRACAKFTSADLAQEAFLARGGPRSDRLGLDPDGDGFACAWDPAPFRAARG